MYAASHSRPAVQESERSTPSALGGLAPASTQAVAAMSMELTTPDSLRPAAPGHRTRSGTWLGSS